MTQQLPPSGAAPAVVPLRQRLPPEVRVLQILDAALVEFSERGFAAARMDDIARRCGLSKGGLYAHFAGKEEVFEALLTRSLAPPDFGQMPVLGPGNGIRPLAQWVVDKLYDSLGALAPWLRCACWWLKARGCRIWWPPGSRAWCSLGWPGWARCC